MITYKQFHGEIPITEIGKELRKVANKGVSFKILTGYGKTSGKSQSKDAALKSLKKMKKEGLIKDFIPGEKITELITNSDDYYLTVRDKYKALLLKDPDRGNDGIVFVFV